ncbi:MAG: hypothetical protein J0I32_19940 [Sphingobacteriales bacterium]|nr:hypothetical protein [Sphingobacteriales bacterium]OJV98783.1 MAG: hypothetical protein BGO52_08395 [Sphingobacteriales bacterium 44-61]
MMNNTEMTKLYDTLLCIPGMNENIKFNLQVNRKLVLLLSQIIEAGIAVQKEQGSVLSFFPDDAGQELKELIADMLEKAGLNSLHEKLKGFNGR